MTTETALPAVPDTASAHSPDATDGPNSSHHGRQDDPKRIEYSRLDRDYSAWYAGEFIGAYPNHLAAERALDDHALSLAEQGVTVLTRPAEPAPEVVEVHTCRTHTKTALVLRPLERQTYEQRWCGTWYDCPEPGCGGGTLIPSEELTKDLERQRATPVQQIFARPAEVVEPAFVAPLLLTCASCGATKPLTAFVNVDQEIVCDACLAADAGDDPATSAATDLAEPASPASAATIAALPFVRAVRHDLRPPLDALDRDAWRCPEAHIFWVENGYIPLECPRCDLLAAVYAGEDRARVTVQRDVLAHFWIDRYADDPAACLEALRRYGAGHQRAVTAAIAAYFGEAIEAVEWVWTATRRRIAALS